MSHVAQGVHFHVEQAPRDRAAISRRKEARILDNVLEREQHAWAGAGVAFVHQHCSALHEIAVALERKVEGRIEQRVARAYEGGERLALRRDESLLERNALVAREHGIARA